MAGHFEAKNTRALVVTDVSYTGLSSERDAQVLKQPVTIDMDLNQWILEAGGGYRATPEIDLLLVGRYYIIDLGGTATSAGGSTARENTQDWGDIYVGARYSRMLDEKLFFSARGDVGFGGSDFAWFGDVAIGYKFTNLFSAGIAYRILSLDYEGGDDSVFVYDMTTYGAQIGGRFHF
jgi:hypothetical protein